MQIMLDALAVIPKPAALRIQLHGLALGGLDFGNHRKIFRFQNLHPFSPPDIHFENDCQGVQAEADKQQSNEFPRIVVHV